MLSARVALSTKLSSSAWRRTRPSLRKEHREIFFTCPGGKHARNLDRALPGKHTKKIYDKIIHAQDSVLAQMRIGHSTLCSFLAKIKKVTSETCDCSLAPETVNHFLLYCPKWVRRVKVFTAIHELNHKNYRIIKCTAVVQVERHVVHESSSLYTLF